MFSDPPLRNYQDSGIQTSAWQPSAKPTTKLLLIHTMTSLQFAPHGEWTRNTNESRPRRQPWRKHFCSYSSTALGFAATIPSHPKEPRNTMRSSLTTSDMADWYRVGMIRFWSSRSSWLPLLDMRCRISLCSLWRIPSSRREETWRNAWPGFANGTYDYTRILCFAHNLHSIWFWTALMCITHMQAPKSSYRHRSRKRYSFANGWSICPCSSRGTFYGWHCRRRNSYPSSFRATDSTFVRGAAER